MKLTNREAASIIWDTMYPERRTFKELDESTKVEWEKYAEIARSVFELQSEIIKISNVLQIYENTNN